MYLIKRIIVLIIVLFSIPLTFYGQSKNFIFIQNEKKLAFYVILNHKNNSSTPEGYIILPQIPQGKHIITIGFARNMYPEQQFLLDIAEDKGYSLKRSGDNWQLFDLNNFTTINSVTNIDSAIAASKKVDDVLIKKTDTMAVIKEQPKPVVVVEPVVESVVEKKVDPIEVIHKKDSVIPVQPIEKQKIEPVADMKSDSVVVIHKKDNIKPVETIIEQKTEPIIVKVEEVKKSSSIRLILEKQQATGIDKIFTDSTEYGIDTVAIYIPMAAIAKSTKTVTGTIITSAPQQDKQALTEEEFRKLRLSMASASTDEDMIAVAVKGCNNKVMEVRQIRNLSSLFLNESSKLAFFKAMKNNTKDSTNFSSLEVELSEPKNVAAFKTLLNN